jgi:outer membrane receptor protein involved in Fe transport
MSAENNLVAQTKGNAITRNAIAAADAVLDPATGEIVCRSTLAGFDPGCVPMNLFGEGSPSQASIDFATGSAVKDLTLEQQIVSLTLRGSPLTLPAGDVNIATGVEYRKETATQYGDPISTRIDNDDGLRGSINRLTSGVPGGFQLSNPQPLKGNYDVKEFFVEADAPLVTDKTLIKSLSLNGAVRVIEYSTVGNVTTWKAGISYEPFDDLRLRATRSRDIRAANIQELFTGVQNALAVVRIDGGTSSALGQRRGNPDLDPEIADTVTYGMVYQPAWIPGFGATVDYYSIDIEGAIQQLSNQQTVDQCANGSQVACAQITTNSSGLLIINTPYLNLAGLKASGVDLELNYANDIGSGEFTATGLISYLDTLETTVPGAPSVDRAGDIGANGTPHWSGSFMLNYNQGPWDFYLQERFIGSGSFDNTLPPNSLADDKVDPVFYTDITAKYAFDAGIGKAELFGTVNNLFDKDPPIVPFSPYGVYRSTNPGLYDVVGRYFTVGLKLRF